jgi:hypothetical protein
MVRLSLASTIAVEPRYITTRYDQANPGYGRYRFADTTLSVPVVYLLFVVSASQY